MGINIPWLQRKPKAQKKHRVSRTITTRKIQRNRNEEEFGRRSGKEGGRGPSFRGTGHGRSHGWQVVCGRTINTTQYHFVLYPERVFRQLRAKKFPRSFRLVRTYADPTL